ncbi:MAG: porin [Verrucomicrobiota bacterium]
MKSHHITHPLPVAINLPQARKQILLGAAAALLVPSMASAADPSAGVNPLFESIPFEETWSLATLYKDAANPILEEFKLRGRYQGQYWDVDADQGSQSGWEDRRSRFGFDAKLFDKKLEARVDFQSNDGFDDVYDGLVDAYLRWKPVSWLSITAGKTKPLIAQYDWLESTTSQPTFERSQIFNQLGINRAAGLTVEGTAGEWSWRTGVYSNATPSSTGGSGAFGDGEFGDFNEGVSFSLGGGYDFSKSLCTDKADLRVDWLHSEREAGDLVLGKYDDIVSASFVVKENAAGVVVEGYYAAGGDGDDSNVFGFFIQPTYDILPNQLQLVGRYSYANSEGPLGVLGQSRYERTVAASGGRGDSYHSLYGGIQYFIYGDKLKLLAGAEWAQLRGGVDAYDGVTFLTGVRLSF